MSLGRMTVRIAWGGRARHPSGSGHDHASGDVDEAATLRLATPTTRTEKGGELDEAYRKGWRPRPSVQKTASESPPPVGDPGVVFAVGAGVEAAFLAFVDHLLAEVSGRGREARDAVDDVDDQAVAVEVV